ncbi:hypothetical protein IU479_28265 [Nocardia abscessus]|uniref:hypothetical protein n=1 Tax=Nocardia TaxID=1817 RepID=UPI0018942480|nr:MULTISPECIES: hypothetical protein [Nocardia]MBF6221996.1 hypothetical protein [Nocardia abscessus]MDE1673302.1 hypothetical protein [Nocardia gipuzkoensis]
MNVRNTALTWFRCCWQVILGVASGAALFFFCVMALSGYLSFWAVPMGSFSALAIWIVIVAIGAVRMHFRGWNFARIQFLSGLGVIPCYTGITMIIAVSIEGLW